MSPLQPEIQPEESAEQKFVDHFESDFKETIDTILSSHDSTRSLLKTATADHLAKLQQKFDLALRVSSFNPDKQDVTRFVLNTMFENINEALVESSQSSDQVMRQNLDLARQSIFGLNKKIRSTFCEKGKRDVKPSTPSNSDFDANLRLFLKMSVFILIFLLISVFSQDLLESYRNTSLGERFVQSVLLMSFTFVLYYLKQFQ